MGRYKRVMHFQSHSRRISECINFIKKKKLTIFTIFFFRIGIIIIIVFPRYLELSKYALFWRIIITLETKRFLLVSLYFSYLFRQYLP